MNMIVWSNDLLSDRWTFSDNDVEVGYVEPVGASWACFYKGEQIAIRPDRFSAQQAVHAMHAECA